MNFSGNPSFMKGESQTKFKIRGSSLTFRKQALIKETFILLQSLAEVVMKMTDSTLMNHGMLKEINMNS